MTRYLLAAEADKIQDFIFRSSHLREVVGGSQLLTRFCKKVPGLLLPLNAELLVSDGGSFRILFDQREQAQIFGERLAEVYRTATSGSLTVGEPEEIEEPVDENFCKASQRGEENLRQAKWWSEAWQSVEHLPYMAFCASCGIGMAVVHRIYYPGQEPQYLCSSCSNKGMERPYGKLGPFLKAFYEVAVGTERDPDTLDWPGKTIREELHERDPEEDIAAYDPRRYVAYLLADGDNMGKVFSACRTPIQMHCLSEGLSQAVRKALAEPTRLIMDNHPGDRPDFIPVLPLILGGDDLFALVPAPWALDFARRFCRAYEREMTHLFEEVGLHSVPSPTVSTAVVICKSKYPYALAHEAGEKRLKEAKRMGKRLVLDGRQPCSTVNFEVVLGGRLVTHSIDNEIRPTLRPYWVDEQKVPDGWGLPLKQLIDQREALIGVPHKRLSEIQSLYDTTYLPTSRKPDDIAPWQDKLERLLQRIKLRSQAQVKAVTVALASLGSDNKPYWRRVDRYEEDLWHGQGVPDLLETWDFALNLEKPLWEYEEE